MGKEKEHFIKAWAKEAVDYTVGKLTLGRANKLSDWYTLGPDESWYSGPGKQLAMGWGMFVLRMHDQIGDDIQLVQCRANVAKGVGVGNCQEHAAVSFDYLAKKDRRPLAIMETDNHAFTIVGYNGTCNFMDPSTFPDWSWVSDPWKRTIYRTNSLPKAYYAPVILLDEKVSYPNYLDG